MPQSKKHFSHCRAAACRAQCCRRKKSTLLPRRIVSLGMSFILATKLRISWLLGVKAARPRGCVFRNGAHIRLVHAGRIAVTHAHARIGDTAHAVCVHCFGLAHLLTAGKAHLFDVNAPRSSKWEIRNTPTGTNISAFYR